MICDKIGVVVFKVYGCTTLPSFQNWENHFIPHETRWKYYNWWMYNIETSIRSKYIEASRILMDSLYKVNGTTKDCSFNTSTVL